jgi:hypothetical protein
MTSGITKQIFNDLKQISWSLGLDLSTTNVGISLWNEEGQLIELKHLKLIVDKSIPEEDRYIYKAELFRTYIKEFKEKTNIKYKVSIKNIFIEAPLTNTPVNINTTAKLLSFNGIACYIIYELFNVPPKLITVYQARKLFNPELIVKTKKRTGEIKETLSFPKEIDKKEYIWKKVNQIYKNIDWFYNKRGDLKKENYDLSDSIAVAVSGLIVINVINNWKEINNKCLKELQ